MDKRLFAIVLLFLHYTAIIESKDIPPTIVPHTNSSSQAPPTANKTLESKNGTGVSTDVKAGPVQQVTLYYFDIHSFLGIPWTMNVPSCVRVPNLLYRKASIVDTQGACMTLYSREQCKGRRVVIDPKESKDNYTTLATINFDHTLVSLQPCNNAKESHIPADKGNTSTSGTATAAHLKSVRTPNDPKPAQQPVKVPETEKKHR